MLATLMDIAANWWKHTSAESQHTRYGRHPQSLDNPAWSLNNGNYLVLHPACLHHRPRSEITGNSSSSLLTVSVIFSLQVSHNWSMISCTSLWKTLLRVTDFRASSSHNLQSIFAETLPLLRRFTATAAHTARLLNRVTNTKQHACLQ